VGSIGLFINIIGLALFHSHHSSGHGHSHGHGHGHGEVPSSSSPPILVLPVVDPVVDPAAESSDHTHDEGGGAIGVTPEPLSTPSLAQVDDGDGHAHKPVNLNMHGVFLHILGDFLGSLGVILSGVSLMFMEAPLKYYVDPAVSLIIALILMKSSIPLVKSCSKILLMSVPTHINLQQLRFQLEKASQANVHDLHVWQLVDNTIIGSAHVTISGFQDFAPVMSEMKQVFHNYGIHSTSIQPEFLDISIPQKCKALCLKDCKNKDVCCKPVSIQGPKSRSQSPAVPPPNSGE
jgi:zinc transporter 1